MLLEMSRDLEHGGKGWEFSKCVWAPIKKENGSNWPFWNKVEEIKKGEIILHLQGTHPSTKLTGFSIAASDGYRTKEKPPIPGQWDFASEFFRAELEGYTPFPSPIVLNSIFRNRDEELRNYFAFNSGRPRSEKLNIFYVIQSGRLQCLNGAYLSDFDKQLANIILGSDFSGDELPRSTDISVATGQRIQMIRARVGQSDFSQNARSNYGSKCCFPGCTVDDPQFLIGAHIARWADRSDLRGRTDNGLCFCLMHDKGFEEGYFTIGLDATIIALQQHSNSHWHAAEIIPREGQPIMRGKIAPSEDAIKEHWKRHDYVVN